MPKCCHGGGTDAAETTGGGIGGGPDDGKCPTPAGGNLGAAGDMAHGGGGPESYIIKHTSLDNIKNNKIVRNNLGSGRVTYTSHCASPFPQKFAPSRQGSGLPIYM